jgi:hypothetical protein
VSRATRWLGSHRRSTVVAAVVVLALLALSLSAVRSTPHGGTLDPDNPEADGGRVVARVLARHGVQVIVVRRAAALARTPLDRDTTVVVTSTDQLGGSTARALGRHGTRAGALVLAEPRRTVLRALDLPLEVAMTELDGSATRCDDRLLDGLSVDVASDTGYRGHDDAQVVGCFEGRGEHPAALVARVDGGVPTYAVGGVGALTNDRVSAADNAAVALRLLGQHDRLVWYVPDLRDVRAGDGDSLSAQLPGGLLPALWLGAAALLATMVWRGRRLGPLVVEPLPVVVKAIESTQGRGRLYRKVRDREHAAEILRSAARGRLALRLRLPARTEPDALVRQVAHATGRDAAGLHDLLLSRPVPDDTTLTRLADELAALEEEVHRP